ncbi:adenylate kinase isoenzyme 5-like isoform X2 [Dicentrarchus labrax]|uniref:adenylate kinase isoenzyme 5-like isoform X2 n=1 Tax=Dicentrarchus labrax TaxID=13489 RepID=UPI0021F5D724|nr:adenylate kinase isoenzyme 5-like isoform X2 [Dicentrarchus labrax]
MMSTKEAKEYLSHHHVPQLLESLLTGLLYHRPEDPVDFLQRCLITTRQLGGPESVAWDTFIHLERLQLSLGPPRTTSVPPIISQIPSIPPRPTSVAPIITQISSILPKATSVPPTTSSVAPIILQIPTTAPLILPLTPSIPPKITVLPPIKPQISPPMLQIPQKIHPIPQTTPLIPQKIPLIPQTIPSIPQTTSTTPWITPPMHPTFMVAPPTHSGPQTPKTSALVPLTPQVSTINSKTPPGTAQTTPEPKLFTLGPPGPAVARPVHSKRGTEKEQETVSTEVQSQLSIDSDSDMTESSGLLLEVSILPPRRSRPLIIFIIGGPGSGKGSQAAKLARCFSLRVLSLDELLRRQLLSHASPSRKWRVISEMMGHGELGPQEETISELRRQLIGQQEVRGFIVDGFPPDVHQALSFQEQIGSPDLVMLLLCSNETLRCRLQRRATQLGLLGDNSYALRRRLETFQRDIVSISRYYRQLHLLTQVDADRDEEVVFSDLSSVIREKLLPKDLSDFADIPECSSVIRSVNNNSV